MLFELVVLPVELLSILVPFYGVEGLFAHVVVAAQSGPSVYRLVAGNIYVQHA